MIQVGNTRPHLSPNIPPRLSKTLGQLEDQYTRRVVIMILMSTRRLNLSRKKRPIHQESTENESKSHFSSEFRVQNTEDVRTSHYVRQLVGIKSDVRIIFF